MIRSSRLMLSTIVLSATVLYGATAMAVQVFPGKNRANVGLETEDIIVHRMSDEFYAESWYFMGRLQDGSQIFIHYGLSNAGFGDFTGAVEATVIDTDGTVHFEKTTIKKDKITYDEKALDVSYDGQHSIKGTPARYEMKSDGDKIGFDLVVTPIVPGLKFGDGTTWFDAEKKEFYNLAILTPKGKIQGSLTTKGKTRKIQGYAYGDHAWQNYPAHKMADRLFSMRGFDKDSSVAFLLFRTADFDIPTLVLTKDEQVVLATTQLDIKESKLVDDDDIRKYAIATHLDISSKGDGPAVNGTIEFTDRLMRQDPTKEFSFFERTLIKMFVAKPILYRYDTKFNFELPTAEGVTAPAEAVSGNGVVEAMILRSN